MLHIHNYYCLFDVRALTDCDVVLRIFSSQSFSLRAECEVE